MNADASDSRVSPGEMAEPESESEPQIQPQAATTPLGEARSVLDGEDCAPFPGPKTFADKLFWRTLSDRQKMIARLLRPLGFRWNIGHPAILRFAASLVAIAVTIRLVSSSEYTWLALAAGTTAVFMFAPPLPGYQFIFQRLYLGGRCATRCQLFPVSVSEICSVLSRCQTIRAAAAWWIGAAYGALAWSIMGAPVRVGVAAGLSLILISYGFHPLVLVAKLSRVTRDRGRRFAFFPSLFVVGLTAVIGLIATLVSIIAMIMFGTEPSRVLSSLLLMLLFMLSFAAALRFSGWILLKIYLLMIERSWLDAVVKIPGKR